MTWALGQLNLTKVAAQQTALAERPDLREDYCVSCNDTSCRNLKSTKGLWGVCCKCLHSSYSGSDEELDDFFTICLSCQPYFVEKFKERAKDNEELGELIREIKQWVEKGQVSPSEL